MSSIELSFLTDDRGLVEICKTYWARGPDGKFVITVTELARQLGMKPRDLAQLINSSCVALSLTESCSVCGRSRPFISRSDFQQRSRYPASTWKCAACSQGEAELARAQQIALDQQRQKKIFEILSKRRTELLNPRDLSLDNAVYLLSLVRVGASEDFARISSLRDIGHRLSPRKAYDVEIVHQLNEAGIISIHPESPTFAFEFSDEKLIAYFPESVMWRLPSPSTDDPARAVDLVADLERIFRNGDWPRDWHDQWLPLWQRIAMEECLQYLEFVLKEHGLPFRTGEKTRMVLAGVLTDYSVAQAFNMIWRAAKDAAAFLVRERVPKQHAANTVVGSIQRQAERAKAEGWDVKAFKRNFECPQSMLSEVLFDLVLGIGEAGFNKVPGDLDEDTAPSSDEGSTTARQPQ